MEPVTPNTMPTMEAAPSHKGMSLIIALLVVVLALGGLYYFLHGREVQAPTEQNQNTVSTADTSSDNIDAISSDLEGMNFDDLDTNIQ